MASNSPKSKVRFLADNFDLIEALCRFTNHSHFDVEELLQQYSKDKNITPGNLVQAEILDIDESRGRYAVIGYIKAFVDKLLQRRRLVDSKLIEGAVENLNVLRESLETSLRIRSFTRVEDLVLNIQETVESIKNSVEGNLEAIHRSTEEFRKSPPRSAKDRWKRIRELWEEYVLPMQEIFVPTGPFDEASVKLLQTLEYAEERAPHKIEEDFQWARFHLRRLGVNAFRAYKEAAHEVQPLYDQEKRNAQVALSASALISAYHRQALHHGTVPEEDSWDEWFGLMDPWDEDRTRKPFGTSIATWLAQAYYKRPNADEAPLVPPPKNFRVPLSDKAVGHRFQRGGGQADDLLLWLRQEFPEATLREILRAYHCLLKATQVNREGSRRTISHPEAEITSKEIEGRLHGAA